MVTGILIRTFSSIDVAVIGLTVAGVILLAVVLLVANVAGWYVYKMLTTRGSKVHNSTHTRHKLVWLVWFWLGQ